MTVITGAAVFVWEGWGWSGLVLFIFKSYDDKMRWSDRFQFDNNDNGY